MILWWLLIPAALVGFVILSRSSVYSAFFSVPHLQEIADLCPALHQEAVDALQTPPETPPNRITSARITIAYTLTPQDDKYRAYLSLSYQGGWFAASAAGILLAFLRRFLALPAPFTLLGVSSRGVYHAAVILDAIPTLTPVSIQDTYEAALTESNELTIHLARPLDA